MSNEAGSSDLADPLQGYSYLSLFPRTFRDLIGVAKQTELSNLESVHNVLKRMALKESGRHIEQARRIVESVTEDTQSEIAVNAAVLTESEGVELINEENARKRRLGLGREKAKFNFNFNRRISQPIVIKEPTLDFAKLEDPEQFFLAHERLENAKKELRNQRGIFTDIDVNDNDLSPTARPRRPGIPGRLKATYKHHCPSVVFIGDGLKESSVENVEKGIISQSLSLQPESVLSLDTSKQNHQSPSNNEIQQETTDPIKDGVLGGSITKVNKFLDEILSGTYDHLNSDGQLTLLQEQLQIKPINIDKSSLPKLPGIPKYDFKIAEKSSKPRKPLPDVKAAFTSMSTNTPVRAMHSPSSIHLSASPTPPKSPFAYLSSLKKRIMQSNRSKSPFSDFDTDPYPVRGSSPVDCADKQPDSVIVPDESRSRFKVYAYDEDVSTVSNKSSHREVLQDSRDLRVFMDDESTVVARTSSILPKQSVSALVDKNGIADEPESRSESYNGSPTNELSDTQTQYENVTHSLNLSRCDSSMNAQHRSPDAESYGKQSTFPNLGSEQYEDIQVENVIEISINKKTRRKTIPVHRTNFVRKRQGSKGRQRRKSIAAAGTDAQEHEPISVEVQAECIIPKMSTQLDSSIDNQGHSPGTELHENSSELPDTRPEIMDGSIPKSPLNKQSKAMNLLCEERTERAEDETRSKKRQKRKELSLRKSIAVAGTCFESGVRRSTRLKMRPLEFWRGERFLYGRLEPDSTLPIVIGIKKYASPDRQHGKKSTLQVVDCVDGHKYRELIDLAALH